MDIGIVITLIGAFGVVEAALLRLGFYANFGVSLDEAGLSGYQLLMPGVLVVAILTWFTGLAVLFTGAWRSGRYGIQYAVLTVAFGFSMHLLTRGASTLDFLAGSGAWVISTAIYWCAFAIPLSLFSYVVSDIRVELIRSPAIERRGMGVLILVLFALTQILYGFRVPLAVSLASIAVAIIGAILLRRSNVRKDSTSLTTLFATGWNRPVGMITILSLSVFVTYFFQRADEQREGAAIEGRGFITFTMLLLGLGLVLDIYPAIRQWFLSFSRVWRPVLAAAALLLVTVSMVATWTLGLIIAEDTKSLPLGTDATNSPTRLSFASLYLGLGTTWVCIRPSTLATGSALSDPVQLLPSAGPWITWDRVSGTRRWSQDGLTVQALDGRKSC